MMSFVTLRYLFKGYQSSTKKFSQCFHVYYLRFFDECFILKFGSRFSSDLISICLLIWQHLQYMDK